MYRIEYPSDATLKKQLAPLKKRIEELINQYLPSMGKYELKNVVNNKHLKLSVKVKKNSITEWFLKWLLESNHIEELLIGDMDALLGIVKKVEDERVNRNIKEEEVYCSLSQDSYVRLYNKGVKISRRKKVTVDHFQTILYEIFVKQGYNGYIGKGETKRLLFDKADHVKGLNLRICPYCGRSFIYSVEENGTTVKPQVDHFLPKSKYPYLALSYFNLIPVCQTCNMKDCKGEFDPMIKIGERPFSLIYPYEFNNNLIDFKPDILKSDYYDDSSFAVTIDYRGNADLEKAMKDELKLEAFYKYHNHEVGDIFRQLLLLQSKAKIYYKAFGITPTAFNPTPKLILGFSFNEKNSRNELLYLLRKKAYEEFSVKVHI